VKNVYRYRRKQTRRTRVRRGQLMRSRLRAFVTLVLFLFVLGTLGVAAAGFVTYRAYAHNLKPPQDAIAESTIGTSLAFDRGGQTLLWQYTDGYGGLKDPVPLSEISPFLIAATIA